MFHKLHPADQHLVIQARLKFLQGLFDSRGDGNINSFDCDECSHKMVTDGRE